MQSRLSPQIRAAWYRRAVAAATAAVVLIALAGGAGCQRINQLRGKGYEGADAEWGAKYRPKGDGSERYFFDERAAQIESSLGL